MTETIKYLFSIVVAGGPRVNHAAQLEVEAYDLLEVEVPGKANSSPGTATVDVQPSSSGVKLLVITAANYAGLQHSVDGGTTNFTLDAPLLLVGESAVELLPAAPMQFLFTNDAEEVNAVNILVGRDATV